MYVKNDFYTAKYIIKERNNNFEDYFKKYVDKSFLLEKLLYYLLKSDKLEQVLNLYDITRVEIENSLYNLKSYWINGKKLNYLINKYDIKETAKYIYNGNGKSLIEIYLKTGDEKIFNGIGLNIEKYRNLVIESILPYYILYIVNVEYIIFFKKYNINITDIKSHPKFISVMNYNITNYLNYNKPSQFDSSFFLYYALFNDIKKMEFILNKNININIDQNKLEFILSKKGNLKTIDFCKKYKLINDNNIKLIWLKNLYKII